MKRRSPLRLLGAALAGALLLAACGSSVRPQADQDRDGRMLAAAVQAALDSGQSFAMDELLGESGGSSIPSGKAIQLHATVTGGRLRQDTARFSYRIDQGNGSTANFDMLVASEQLFARQHGASAWKVTPLPAVTALFPALRLDLVRETVLLAASVSSGAITHISAGFAHEYTIKPAPDQLEQLEAVSVSGQGETQFLKTARAQVNVFLVMPGNRLGRVEVNVSGVDPADGTKQQIQNSIDVRSARVSVIQPPSDAQAVTPANILT